MATTLRVGTARGGLPLLGHAIRFKKDPLALMASLPEHGDLVEVKLGRESAYLLCHPDLVHQVLLDERTFDKQGKLWDKLRKFTGDGIGTCPFSSHRRQRRLVQPAFHRPRMPGYADVMSRETAAVTDEWRDGQTIDMLREMYAITTRVMAKTLMSGGVGVEAATEVCRSMDVVMHGTYQRATSPLTFLERLPTPANRRFAQVSNRVHTAVDQIVREYRRPGGAERDDMLSVMMSTRDDEGNALSDIEVRDQIIILVTAGMETTASAISWTFSLLAQHPDIEARLHEEVDGVLGERQATWDDLPKLNLTQRIVHESLRMYPPGWLFSRSATRDTELAGHHIPAGTTLFYSPYIVHRRADLFPDPERFDPDRWLDERAHTIPRGAFMPFGVGGRKCIGDNFAMIEAPLAVSSIAARWRLMSVDGHLPTPSPQFALNPQSTPMRLRRRRPDA